jgi:hypothetical protein
MCTGSSNSTRLGTGCNGGPSSDEWTLLPPLLHFNPVLFLNADERIDLLIIVLKHLPESSIILNVLLHVLFRDRALYPQEILENLEVFRIDLFQLGLPMIIFSDGQVAPEGSS